ncbi:MAG: isocitrate/isopropylmalate family dehydrogenase [Bryobacteraceae bacterium]
MILREITEDIYMGRERRLEDGCAEAVKRITRAASIRLARFACQFALARGRCTLCAIHKANVLHLTDGLFLTSVRETVSQYPELRFDECAVDAACYRLVKQPEAFDVLLCPTSMATFFLTWPRPWRAVWAWLPAPIWVTGQRCSKQRTVRRRTSPVRMWPILWR